MPTDDQKHLTGLYDPDAPGHSLVEFHPMTKLPEGVPASVDGKPVTTLRYLRPEQYPEGVPADLPIVAVDVYTGLFGQEGVEVGRLLYGVYRDLQDAAAAVEDAFRMMLP